MIPKAKNTRKNTKKYLSGKKSVKSRESISLAKYRIGLVFNFGENRVGTRRGAQKRAEERTMTTAIYILRKSRVEKAF